MVERISTKQTHLIMSVLATNVNWRSIDFDESKLKDLVINDPERAGRQFAIFLQNGGRVVVGNGAFPIWKTVNYNAETPRSATAFRKALKKAGYKIDEWGTDILGNANLKTLDKDAEVGFVVVTSWGLGLRPRWNEIVKREDVYTRARDLGLELCKPKDAPMLRLRYRKQ